MDDMAVRRYFTHPAQVYQRRYEAVRAVFVEGRPQKEVAEAFGFQYHALRQLVYEFRHWIATGQVAAESPFFARAVVVESRSNRVRPRSRSSRIDGR
jgi:hypothetical protein